MRAALLLLLLCSAAARADEPGPSFGDRLHFTESGGAALYAGICAGCHMRDGRGAVGAGAYPALAGDGNLAATGYPIARVLAGHGDMPGFAHTLSDEQVAAVVDYIRTHFGNGYGPAPTAAEVHDAR